MGYLYNSTVEPLLQSYEQSINELKRTNEYQNIKNYIALAIAGNTGIAHLADFAMAYHPVCSCNWGLVIIQNEKELYLPLYRKMSVIYGLSFLIYYIILIGIWFIIKPLSGRILLHADELETRILEKTESLESEIVERKKTEEEKKKIIVELREAAQQIKTLSGLIPVCSNCKKIHDDKDYWNQIESYISDHSDAMFSHGICPECRKELYPDINDQD